MGKYLLQMTSARPSGNDEAVHGLDADLGLTPLNTPLHELVRRLDALAKVDVLDRHRDGLERDHERVHRPVSGN